MTRLICRKEVEHITGLKRTLIYDMVKHGRFPAQIKVGKRAVRWHESEIIDFIADPQNWAIRKAMKENSAHLACTKA